MPDRVRSIVRLRVEFHPHLLRRQITEIDLDLKVMRSIGRCDPELTESHICPML